LPINFILKLDVLSTIWMCYWRVICQVDLYSVLAKGSNKPFYKINYCNVFIRLTIWKVYGLFKW